MSFDKMIEFEKMSAECPWMVKKQVNIRILEICTATGTKCSYDGCALFYWINNLRNRIHVNIKLD